MRGALDSSLPLKYISTPDFMLGTPDSMLGTSARQAAAAAAFKIHVDFPNTRFFENRDFRIFSLSMSHLRDDMRRVAYGLAVD